MSVQNILVTQLTKMICAAFPGIYKATNGIDRPVSGKLPSRRHGAAKSPLARHTVGAVDALSDALLCACAFNSAMQLASRLQFRTAPNYMLPACLSLLLSHLHL